MVNHTDALVGYLAEAAPRHLIGHDPFRIEELVRKMGRDDFSRAGEVMSSRYRHVRNRLLGHRGQGPGAASLQPARRSRARQGQGLRQRLVQGRAHARGVPRGREEGCGARVQGLEAGSLRPGPLRAGVRGEKMQAVSLVEAVQERHRTGGRRSCWRCTAASPLQRP